MIGSIYLLRNERNGKRYVGQTRQSPAVRLRQHDNEDEARRGYPLARAIRKYGIGAFSMTVLCTTSTQQELNELEKRYAYELHTFVPEGYNLRAGDGNGSWSPAARKHISLAKRGVPMNPAQYAKHKETMNRPDVRAVLSKSRKGRPLSYQHRQNIADAMKRPEVRFKAMLAVERRRGRPGWNRGNPTSLETRLKLSMSLKGTPTPTKASRCHQSGWLSTHSQ